MPVWFAATAWICKIVLKNICEKNVVSSIMAKKFRTHSAYDDADHRNEKPAKQKSSSGVANLMGLSLNSKKIKKEKKRKDNGPKNLDVVSGSVGTNNSGSESAMQSEKKKKGKKHKTPKTEPFGSGGKYLGG